MATVTITFSDTVGGPMDGALVDMRVQADPPLDLDGTDFTSAQMLGIKAMAQFVDAPGQITKVEHNG